MGIYITYNEWEKKWQIKGCGFIWYYSTKEQALADRKRAWEQHTANLNAWKTVMNMLVAYR